MEHRALYVLLTSPGLRGRVLDVIRTQGYFEVLKARSVRVVDAEPLPYFLFELCLRPDIGGCCGGLFLNLDGIVSNPPEGEYFLPFIGVTPSSSQHELDHELQHLHDILDFIAVEPSYPADLERLSIHRIRRPEDIPESIRFEVRSIFLFEVPAFCQSFDTGIRTVQYSEGPDRHVEYLCESRDEFLCLRIGRYLAFLRQSCLGRFSECAELIDSSLEESTNTFGGPMFGPGASRTIAASCEGFPLRVLKQQIGMQIRRVLTPTQVAEVESECGAGIDCIGSVLAQAILQTAREREREAW
jgi:hypothetical protein